MTESFASLISPVIRHVNDLLSRIEHGEHPALDTEKKAIRAHLDQASQRVPRELESDFDLARRAVIFWIDDVLINSPWTQAEDWKHKTMQWEYYNINTGGDDFFVHAADAEKRANSDALETFFLCVAMGFRGNLAFAEDRLKAWSERVYTRIEAGDRQPEHAFEEDPKDEEIYLLPLPGANFLLGASILVAISAIVTAIGLIVAVGLQPPL